jgi:hypothetical protein
MSSAAATTSLVNKRGHVLLFTLHEQAISSKPISQDCAAFIGWHFPLDIVRSHHYLLNPKLLWLFDPNSARASEVNGAVNLCSIGYRYDSKNV